ncbi:MAG: hypothetical protein P4L27_09495 [Ignavibacteriaceae bacterium]|nr:hypothetical protein [Ignavibacteriaceae bacterium]
MILQKTKTWLHNYNIVLFLILVTLGWVLLWGAWMIFIMITHPH